MKYYNEIEEIIKNNEANKKVRDLKVNYETLKANWEIGRLLVEAQGGEKRAKYGNGLIKGWGIKLSEKYGKKYSASELRKMRQYNLEFSKCVTLSRITWSHIVSILPIKNESERNYYLNQVIINNLSVRDLRKEISNKSFNRLSYADKGNIKLIEDNSNYNLTIEDMIKDPIILKANKNINDLNEYAIHKFIIELLENKFLELGVGFALIGHEYKIIIERRTYKIDLLFFNIELNSYVVVEVKSKELKQQDISQLEFYVKYIDKNIRKKHHNKTIGILIVKKNNEYVVEYTTTTNDIFFTTYDLI